MRRSLVLWHRWFGLIGGIWLLLMAATGSILVFYEEIDRALNPDLFTASAGPSRPADALAAAAVAGRPESIVRYINLPDEPGDVARVYLAPRPAAAPIKDAPAWEVMVDPASAVVLGLRDRNAIDLGRRGVMAFLYKFHHSLHGGPWVEWLLGLLALAWTLDHVAAVVLAVPNPRRWRDSLRLRRGVAGHKRVFDLHRAGGLWLLPVTLVLAVSGVYFNLPDTFRTVVSAASPVTPRPDQRAPDLPRPLEAPPVSFSRAVAAVPAARVDGVAYNAAKGLYWLRVFDPRDIDSYGRRWIYVDARSARVVSDSHAASGTAGDVIMAWQFPLHSGKAFGWTGRLLIFVAGLAVSGFVVTGFLIWGRKAKARRRSEAARRGRPAAGAIPAPAE